EPNKNFRGKPLPNMVGLLTAAAISACAQCPGAARASRFFNAVVCGGRRSPTSIRSTVAPRRSNALAHAMPAGPEPTTAMRGAILASEEGADHGNSLVHL